MTTKSNSQHKDHASTASHSFRPLNVHVAPGSVAEKLVYARAGLPGASTLAPEVIAPGIKPTPSHDLVFHGGKTITSLNFTNFYIGGSAAWQQSDIHAIDNALAAAMSDVHLNNVIQQYFHNQPITSTFKFSQVLTGSPMAVFSQGDMEHLVQQLYTQGKLQGFDFGSTVFNFMLPPGTVLNDDTSVTPGGSIAQHSVQHHPVPPEDKVDSLHGLGGYHGSIHVGSTSGSKQTIYYAIGVYSQKEANGTVNGIPVFDQPWKNVVATFYHELNEARTDADVEDAIRAGNNPNAIKFLGWVSRKGEECGDFPVFEAKPLNKVFKEVPLTTGSGTVPVQFQYSNAVHGPEGPIATPHKVLNPA